MGILTITRTVHVHATDIYQLDLTDALAQECEEYLKKWVASDPSQIPHISRQTLVQAWENDSYNTYNLCQYTFKAQGYKDDYEMRLVDAICDFINDCLWECEPDTIRGNIDWHEDKLEDTDGEYGAIVNAPNPDFPDDEFADDSDASPEGANDRS